MLSPVLVKLIRDVEIVPDKVKLSAGTFVMVLHEYSGETYRGQHTATDKHRHIMTIIEKRRTGTRLIVTRRCIYYPACKHTDQLEFD